MRKAGAKDYRLYSKKILKICKKKPVSLEVFGDNFSLMTRQAYEINSWGRNVYVKIPVVNSTIPHEQNGKFGGSRIFMRPASHGTGVIAGGAMRAVIESVGVKDILAKSKGSSNPHNVVKATMDALLQLRDARSVAAQRGVSMSKVFNGK